MGLRPPSSFSANASAINRVDSLLCMDTPFPRNRQVHTMGPVDRGHFAAGAGPVDGDGHAWGAPFEWNRQVMCSRRTGCGAAAGGMDSIGDGFERRRLRCFAASVLHHRAPHQAMDPGLFRVTQLAWNRQVSDLVDSGLVSAPGLGRWTRGLASGADEVRWIRLDGPSARGSGAEAMVPGGGRRFRGLVGASWFSPPGALEGAVPVGQGDRNCADSSRRWNRESGAPGLGAETTGRLRSRRLVRWIRSNGPSARLGSSGSSGLGWNHWSHSLPVSPKFICSRVRNGSRLGRWLHSLTREPSIWAGSGTFSLERSTLSMPLGWASKVCFSGYILRPLYTLHGKFFVKQQWSLTLLFFQFCDPPIYRQSQHLLRAPISSKRLVGTRSTQGLPRYTATVRKPTIGNCASWCHHTRGKRPSNERYLCHLVPLSASWHRYLSLTDR